MPDAEADNSSTTDPEAGSDQRRRTPALHPLMFAVYPVLALLAHNFSQTPLRDTIRPFAVSIGVMLLVWAICLLLSRSVRKSAIVASTVVLVLFSYGQIENAAPAPAGPLVLPACIIAVLAVVASVWRTRRPLYDTTAVLNLVGIVLVVSPGWQIFTASAHARQAQNGNQKPATVVTHRKLGPSLPGAPDVYYIVLDAHARADRLKQFYQYDESGFIHELEKRGFYVARSSGANYNQTPLCLASALNMEYLDAAKQELSHEGLRKMVDDSAVADALQDHGYHYINVWSGLEESRVDTAERVFNDQKDLSAFEDQALNLTAVGAHSKVRLQRYDNHRARILGVFSGLLSASEMPSPKFVFAHALCPHPPFVLGPNGEFLYPAGAITLADGSWLLSQITTDQYRAGYIGQLQFADRRVLETIDAILARSKVQPIIIIQGDHGSRMTLDWDSVQNTDLREPFSILNAYLVPAKAKSKLYPTITPVNSFRLVLSDLLSAHLNKLQDRSFYSTSNEPYKFTEVTHLIPDDSVPPKLPTKSGPTRAQMPTSVQ